MGSLSNIWDAGGPPTLTSDDSHSGGILSTSTVVDSPPHLTKIPMEVHDYRYADQLGEAAEPYRFPEGRGMASNTGRDTYLSGSQFTP